MRHRFTGRVRALLSLGVVVLALTKPCFAQVESVPANNQVYEFLDRLGVRGIIPLYSTTVIPAPRGEITRCLDSAATHQDQLSETERETLQKFMIEFAADAGTRPADDFVVLGAHGSAAEFLDGAISGKEKYLYAFRDSLASLAVDFIGSAEYRSLHGDSRGDVDATLLTIGGRFRGTIAGHLGYYFQATNGQLSGNRGFALSDPKLSGNVKFNDLQSPNFDVTEAALRLSFGWASVSYGREFTLAGTGYQDRLILSDNAPAFDAFRIDAAIHSFRFTFLHGSILPATVTNPGALTETEPEARKYFVMHRFQVSLFDVLNLGASEMLVYQRQTPEYAYLNPINFFKSAEHQLRDRDNAALIFDVEVFPCPNVKMYGSWFIDDISFGRMGSGWWGNEFAWQGGAYIANLAGKADVDGLLEYVRIEPYVYSNRVMGNDFTHNNQPIGHHLEPNSDEVSVELRWRASAQVRWRLLGAYMRHGMNSMNGDSVTFNAGGSRLHGHRWFDPELAPFLAGDRESLMRVRLRLDVEPITNIFLTGVAEVQHHRARRIAGDIITEAATTDVYLSAGLRLEY